MPLENFSSQSSIIYDEVFESYPQSYHPAIYEEKRKEPVIGETKRRTVCVPICVFNSYPENTSLFTLYFRCSYPLRLINNSQEKRKKQNRDSQRLFRQRQKKKIEALVAQLDNMRNENSCLLEKCEKLTSLVTDRMQDVDENSAHSSIECTESGSCSDQKQKLISKTEIEAWHLDGEYEFP